MEKSVRILVFGSSGAGKTSMLMELTGEEKPVGDGVLGITTFNTSPFEAIQRNHNIYKFLDTAGLNESDKGRIPEKQALRRLVKLLRDSKEGYNLLIHVIRALPRNTALWQRNHEFFGDVICQKRIPVLLVFTGCEDSDPMTLWQEENAKALEQLGLKGAATVCSCFCQPKDRGGRQAMEEIVGPLRKESARSVWEAIETSYSQMLWIGS